MQRSFLLGLQRRLKCPSNDCRAHAGLDEPLLEQHVGPTGDHVLLYCSACRAPVILCEGCGALMFAPSGDDASHSISSAHQAPCAVAISGAYTPRICTICGFNDVRGSLRELLDLHVSSGNAVPVSTVRVLQRSISESKYVARKQGEFSSHETFRQ